MFVVFDTETTGLPRNFKVDCKLSTLSNWDSCRLIQIAWKVYNDDRQLISEDCKMVKPHGFIIPQKSTAIHGITHQLANDKGESIDAILNAFLLAIEGVQTAVAHNISFDNNVIRSELYRARKSGVSWSNITKYCTMKNNVINGCRLPKLTDLYIKEIGPVDRCKLHTANYDVQLCAEIYLKQLAN